MGPGCATRKWEDECGAGYTCVWQYDESDRGPSFYGCAPTRDVPGGDRETAVCCSQGQGASDFDSWSNQNCGDTPECPAGGATGIGCKPWVNGSAQARDEGNRCRGLGMCDSYRMASIMRCMGGVAVIGLPRLAYHSPGYQYICGWRNGVACKAKRDQRYADVEMQILTPTGAEGEYEAEHPPGVLWYPENPELNTGTAGGNVPDQVRFPEWGTEESWEKWVNGALGQNYESTTEL